MKEKATKIKYIPETDWQPTLNLRILKSVCNGNEKLQQLFFDFKNGEHKWFDVPVVNN